MSVLNNDIKNNRSNTWLKSIALTFWLDDISQELVLERFTRDDIEAKYIAIGGIEDTTSIDDTKKGKHFHVLVCLEHSIRFSTLKNKLPSSTHIEPLLRFSNYFDYLSKESLFYSNIDFVKNESNNPDVYTNIVNEILIGLSFKEIIKNHPKYCLLHYDNLLKVYQTLNNKIDT